MRDPILLNGGRRLLLLDALAKGKGGGYRVRAGLWRALAPPPPPRENCGATVGPILLNGAKLYLMPLRLPPVVGLFHAAQMIFCTTTSPVSPITATAARSGTFPSSPR